MKERNSEWMNVPYFPAYKTHRDFSLEILEKKWWWMYFNFSNLLEENRIVTYLVTRKEAIHNQWCQISWFGSKFHCLTIKMLYNSCTGIYKLQNNTYPRCIRCRSNLGHIFRGKSASYGLGNTVSKMCENLISFFVQNY
jgi:hypothetical protein